MKVALALALLLALACAAAPRAAADHFRVQRRDCQELRDLFDDTVAAIPKSCRAVEDK